MPPEVSSHASVQLESGIPFVSDAQLEQGLADASARLDGLKAALAVLALFALFALFPSRRIPWEQPGVTTQT